jgi:hypothetical protein
MHQHGGALLDGVLLRVCVYVCMLLETCVLRCIYIHRGMRSK